MQWLTHRKQQKYNVPSLSCVIPSSSKHSRVGQTCSLGAMLQQLLVICVLHTGWLMLCGRVDEWSKNAEETGRPYRWVQWLCGLQFLEDDPSKVSVCLSRSHMSDTVQRLRARVSDRLSLQKQLAALGLSISLHYYTLLSKITAYFVFASNLTI